MKRREWLAKAWDWLPKPAARWSRLFGLALGVGVLSGVAAAGLEWGIHVGVERLVGRYAHLGQAGIGNFQWGVLLLPALGGLMSGLAIHYLCPGSHAQGTEALIHAFHHRLGDLPLRGPLVKGVAAAGVISCGGSAGPEGPIAALGAGLGSSLGRVFHITPHERRILMVAGCAAGVGSIFQCPLGGALFAAGILYRELEYETDALVPSVVASVIGYSTFITLVPLMGLPRHDYLLVGAQELGFESARWLIPYALLGPLCGLVSIFFALCMRAVEDGLAPRSRLPFWVTPALGGLLTGAIACVVPQVMDGRYRFIQNALSERLFVGAFAYPLTFQAWFLLMVIGLKCVATGCTVGSGAAGGVVGPSVFLGGVVGILLGVLCELYYPVPIPLEVRQSFIPVGMAGVLAASMRVPLAAVVMVTEMTGSYRLIVPLMLVCTGAYVVGKRWGLNREQVPTRAESPAHAADAIIHLLESWKVKQLMDTAWPAIATPEMTLRDLVQRIEPGTRPVFAVLSKDRIMGLISVPDIQRMLEDPILAEALIAADLMTERLSTVSPDDDAYQALSVFQRDNHDVLPVVANNRRRRFVGMLTRKRVFEALRDHVAATQKYVLREHAGLEALGREGRLDQLVMGVVPRKPDNIQRLLVPIDAIGQSLRQADFRRVYGAQVIAIEQRDGTLQCPPDLDAPLQSSQRLLAVVWRDHAPPPSEDVAWAGSPNRHGQAAPGAAKASAAEESVEHPREVP